MKKKNYLDLLIDEKFFNGFSVSFDKAGVMHADAKRQRQPEMLILDVDPIKIRLVHVEPHFRIVFS